MTIRSSDIVRRRFTTEHRMVRLQKEKEKVSHMQNCSETWEHRKFSFGIIIRDVGIRLYMGNKLGDREEKGTPCTTF